MIHAIKSVRTLPPPTLFSSSLTSHLGRKTSSVRFFQATADHKKPENMDKGKDKDKDPDHETGDVTSHPFGEGYATRSDEEGFGCIYGRNDKSSPPEEREDHPEYDKSQGSEVKEKEKARHQISASA